MKCKVCGRRVKKDLNHRWNWVEEQMCGLCFYGKIYGYSNSMNGKDSGQPLRIKVVAR